MRRIERVRGGFTIIEVMIVIAILVALGTVAALALMGQKKQADKDVARMDLRTIQGAIDLFRLSFNRNPTDEEGLRVLWDKSALSADADATRWTGYLREPKPLDPWGGAWQYRAASQHGSEDGFDLWSLGPDKQEGTGDDVTSWGAATAGGTDAGSMGVPPGGPPSLPPPTASTGGGG